MCTINTYIWILVSEDIWAKIKNIVLVLQAQVIENPEVDSCTSSLMSDIGTLVYVIQTYDPLTPYLNFFHLTIDFWRPDRYYDGCKVATARLKS